MSVLFSTRKLADSFLNRSVVLSSEAHRNKLGDLRFVVEFDLGKHGKWSNRIENLSPTPDLVLFNKRLMAYQDDIYEQIGVLEEIERWALSKSPTTPFSHVLLQEKPMFFHAALIKEGLVLQVFGEGLYDFEIRWDFNRAGEQNSFTRKLAELSKTLRDHLRAIEQISFQPLTTREKEEAA